MATVTTAVPENIHIALKMVAAQRRISLITLMSEYLKKGLRRDGMEVQDVR